jgi:chromosome segregation protein
MAEARHADEASAAEARLSEAESALAALPDLDAARSAAEEVRLGVEAMRLAAAARRATAAEIRREGEARDRRIREIDSEVTGWQDRLATAEARAGELAQRRAETESALAAAREAPAVILGDRERLDEAIALAETRRRAAADRLTEAEAVLREAARTEREAERAASDAREARAGAEARAEAAKAAAAEAAQRIREETDLEPDALLSRIGGDDGTVPPAETLEMDVARLRRQREALGAVNLRAEEDAREVEAEHASLTAERADLEAAIAKLRAGIAGLNREGRERLLTAFEEVNTNFRMLFTHLFGGGEANLVLVESEDPLEAGLEIMCQPPGKKLATLSLLSGGEQTLTALALIFAVFLANPAPICVLDEVDAPLDDANVTRFCDLLDEMTRRTDTRFLVITHHAVTMARMDRLFGVTMQEPGVSQLVSVDLKRAEQLVA